MTSQGKRAGHCGCSDIICMLQYCIFLFYVFVGGGGDCTVKRHANESEDKLEEKDRSTYATYPIGFHQFSGYIKNKSNIMEASPAMPGEQKGEEKEGRSRV